MELYQLRTFAIVAEEENLTRAAKRLFTTPPSVSAHIKALEEELQVILFERTPKGMKLTEKGAILRAKAEETLRAAQNLANHATQLQALLLGSLRVGLNATPTFLRVASLVKALQVHSPGLDLKFVAADTHHVLAGLREEQLEAGYIFGPVPPDMVGHRLGAAELVVTAPRSWAARLENATWAEVAGLPWIASTVYCPFQEIVETLFKQQGVALNHFVQADDEATKAELVRAGLGLALLESGEAEQAVVAGQAAIWPTEGLTCPLSLVYPVKKQDDPLLQSLAAVARQVWSAEPMAEGEF